MDPRGEHTVESTFDMPHTLRLSGISNEEHVRREFPKTRIAMRGMLEQRHVYLDRIGSIDLHMEHRNEFTAMLTV